MEPQFPQQSETWNLNEEFLNDTQTEDDENSLRFDFQCTTDSDSI